MTTKRPQGAGVNSMMMKNNSMAQSKERLEEFAGMEETKD
jgi:hypothetical protein